MGDLQDPTDGGTVLVPYVWPYELWWYSRKHRPYLGLIYGRYLHFRFLKFPLIGWYLGIPPWLNQPLQTALHGGTSWFHAVVVAEDLLAMKGCQNMDCLVLWSMSQGCHQLGRFTKVDVGRGRSIGQSTSSSVGICTDPQPPDRFQAFARSPGISKGDTYISHHYNDLTAT